MLKGLLILFVSFSCYIHAGSIPNEPKVLLFAGSTRKDSDNKKLIIEAARIAKKLGAQVTLIDLKDLSIPLYDGDLESEQGMPVNAIALRRLMIDSNVILIASPNYNHSPSGVLKNALDWASRSETGGSSREAFKGKTFALMCASPGKSGGVKGLPPLREIIETIGGTVIPEEVGIPQSDTAFDEKGRLKDPVLQEKLKELVQKALNI